MASAMIITTGICYFSAYNNPTSDFPAPAGRNPMRFLNSSHGMTLGTKANPGRFDLALGQPTPSPAGLTRGSIPFA
jgi:hypothetical protein